MPRIRRHVCLAALFALALGMSSCTLVKPVIGAFTGPVYVLGEVHVFGCGCNHPCAVVGVFAGAAAVGAVAGLVTGLISDFQVLFGDVSDPTRNWWNPFATNG